LGLAASQESGLWQSLNNSGHIMKMASRSYVVNATWDDETQVWFAESDDVPDSSRKRPASMPPLIEKLRVLITELLEANKASCSASSIWPTGNFFAFNISPHFIHLNV
jgi:hypothetical protein